MTFDQVRQDIVTEIERAKTAWIDYPLRVDYDNLSVTDLATQEDPYLMVDILWGDSQQLDLGESPLVADYGLIALAAGVKEGQGTASLLKLLYHFRPYLQLRDNLGVVRTRAAGLAQKPVVRGGFYYMTMMVPFWTVNQAPSVP